MTSGWRFTRACYTSWRHNAGWRGGGALSRGLQGALAFFLRLARVAFRTLPMAWRARVKTMAMRRWRARRPAAPMPLTARLAIGRPGLVSIALPVYNQADLLRNSIRSVLAQTYPDFELIIVNDGSTDGVEAVLDEFATHPKIRILTQDNQKLPKALSNAFEVAQGEFWTWTSADNLMEPEQVATLVAFLQQHAEVAMVYADYLAIDAQGQPLDDPSFRPHNRRTPGLPHIFLPRSTEMLNVLQDNFIGPCFMYRGWVGRLLGEYDPQLGVEDYDYWMRLNALFPVAHLGTDAVLYQYRVHANSLNARAHELKIFERVDRLMKYEAERHAFYQKPWTIYADTHTLGWLRNVPMAPHTVMAWTGGPLPTRRTGKTLVLLKSDSLPVLAQHPPPAEACVAVWFAQDETAPYRHRAAIQGLVHACLTTEATTMARLELFTTRVFPVALGKALLDTAFAFANNHAFYTATRPAEFRQRPSPTVYVPTGRSLRVLLQVDDFDQGGLEQVVLDLAVCLQQEGVEVFLLVLGKAGLAVTKAREMGLTVYTLATEQRASHYRQLLLDQRVDLVNAHYSLFGAALAVELRVPFVQTIHNTYVWLSPQQITAFQEHDRYTAAYICVSDNVAFYTDVRLELPADKMVVLPNGIDPARLDVPDVAAVRARLRHDLGLAAEDFVFLNVASIYAAKAQKPLVQAMARIVQDCPRARLVLLGRVMDEAYATQIKRYMASGGLDKAVIFAGYREDVAAFYRMADAFVLPSFWEGWSLALAEALYANLPVVVSDVGGAPEQVPPAAGCRIPPPFGAMTALDYANLEGYTCLDQPQFVEALAAAMQKVYARPEKPDLPEGFRQRLDRRHAYAAYVRLFHWLRQHGEPAGLRPWLREREGRTW